MIVVKVELWPRGDQKRMRMLGVATIVNDDTGDVSEGNYNCRLFKNTTGKSVEELVLRPLARDTWRHGRVEEFERQRLGGWDLLYRALASLVSLRNADVPDTGDAEFGRAP